MKFIYYQLLKIMIKITLYKIALNNAPQLSEKLSCFVGEKLQITYI